MGLNNLKLNLNLGWLNSGGGEQDQWLLYHDAPINPSKGSGVGAVSIASRQANIDNMLENDDTFVAHWSSDGRNTVEPLDQTFAHVFTKAGKTAADLVNPSNWERVQDDPATAYDGNIILGKGPELNGGVGAQYNGQNWSGSWAMSKDGTRKILFFSGNGPIAATNYGIWTATISDDFLTITRNDPEVGPIAYNEAGSVSYYWPKVYQEGTTYYLLVGLYVPAQERFKLQAWICTDDPEDKNDWSLLTDDIIEGQLGLDGWQTAGNIWKNGSWYEFFYPFEDSGIFKGAASGAPLRYPFGKSITIIRTQDFETFVKGETIYTDTLNAHQGLVNCTGKMTFDGRDFFGVYIMQWKARNSAGGIAEQWTNSKLLVKGPKIGNGIQVGQEVYPEGLSKLFMPAQAYISESVVHPLEVLSGTVGTLVNSPTYAYGNMINPNGGYIQWSERLLNNFENVAFKIRFAEAAAAGNQGICECDAFILRRLGSATGAFQVIIYGENGNAKAYRTTAAIGSTPPNEQIDVNGVTELGFVWNNATQTLTIMVNQTFYTSTGLIKDTDQVIDQLKTSNVKGFRLGYGLDANALNRLGYASLFEGANATTARLLSWNI